MVEHILKLSSFRGLPTLDIDILSLDLPTLGGCELAEFTVWLADRVTTVTNATDSGGIALMDGSSGDGGAGGFAATSTVVAQYDQFTIEIKPESGATLTIERTVPGRLDTILDLK